MKASFSLNPTLLAAFVIKFTLANGWSILKILVFEESFKSDFQRFTHCLTSHLPLYLLPFLGTLLSFYLLHNSVFYLLVPKGHYLFFLVFRSRSMMVLSFGFTLKSMHPSFGQLAAQQALTAELPLIDHSNRYWNQSCDPNAVTDP